MGGSGWVGGCGGGGIKDVCQVAVRCVHLGVLEPEEEALFFSKISATDQ